eukprot:882937-Rhodomonas_salina.5
MTTDPGHLRTSQVKDLRGSAENSKASAAGVLGRCVSMLAAKSVRSTRSEINDARLPSRCLSCSEKKAARLCAGCARHMGH